MSIETEIAALTAASTNLSQTVIEKTSDLASNAVGKGASLIGDDDGTTMQAAIDYARKSGVRLSTEFGDRGPTFDNYTAWQDIMAYLAGGTGRGIMCAPWHSEIIGELNLDTTTIAGVSLLGMQGKSAIRGAANYGILRLGDIDGMLIEGLGFISDYNNAVEDGGKSLLYNFQRNTRNFVLRNNYFRNPLSFTSAFTLYTNIGSANQGYLRDSVLDGLVMEGNTFDEVGRLVCTLMNRKNDRLAMRNIRVRNNVVKKAGSMAPSIATIPAGLHGMFISVDGAGTDIEIVSNDLRSLQGIGIEFAANSAEGFDGVVIRDNKFTDLTRGLHAVSIDDANGTGLMRNFTIANNRAIGSTTGSRHSMFMGLDKTSISMDNVYTNNATDQAVLIRRCNGARFIRDQFINTNATTGRYAMFVELNSAGNVFENCTFDTAASAGNYATVRYSGSTVTDNRIVGDGTNILKGTGGSDFDESTSAVRNTISYFKVSTGEKSREYLAYAMTDADATLSGVSAMKCYGLIRLTGTLTAQRSLNFPHRRLFEERQVAIRNDCNFPIKLQVNGLDGDIMYPGYGGIVVFDPSLNSVRLERINQPSYRGVFTNIAALPSAAGAGDGATAWLNSARNTGEGSGAGTGSLVVARGGVWRIPGIVGAVTE